MATLILVFNNSEYSLKWNQNILQQGNKTKQKLRPVMLSQVIHVTQRPLFRQLITLASLDWELWTLTFSMRGILSTTDNPSSTATYNKLVKQLFKQTKNLISGDAPGCLVPRWFPLFRTIHWRDITLLHKNNLVHTKGRTIWCSLCTLSISAIPKSLVLFASGGPWILVVAMNTTNNSKYIISYP
jgi:hypothetical protein